MSVNYNSRPINKLDALDRRFYLRSELEDFQNLMYGAHLAESRFIKDHISVNIELYDVITFSKWKDDIEEFLHWLTGYDLRLQFSKSKSKSTKQSKLGTPNFDYACLFSGGLDSSSLPFYDQYKDKMGLLHHTHTSDWMLGIARRVHDKFIDKRNKLVTTSANVEGILEKRILHTRGLMFLTNLLCVAKEFEIDRVVIPENGPFMINPPATSIVDPTRTTDPAMIEKWSSLFNKITNSNLKVETPFYEKTKSEVILVSHNSKLVSTTYSCSTHQGQDKMCGICVACFVRMLSLYAIDEGEDLDVCYQYNPFKLNVSDLLDTNQEKLRILVYQLEFWKNLIKPKSSSIPLEPERCTNLVKDYPVLKNHALDMYVGVRNYLELCNSITLIPVTASENLKMLDNGALDSRYASLQKSKQNNGWTVN